MPEYIVEVNQNNTIDLPMEVRDKMALVPGDKMIIRLDNAEEHMVMGKLLGSSDDESGSQKN